MWVVVLEEVMGLFLLNSNKQTLSVCSDCFSLPPPFLILSLKRVCGKGAVRAGGGSPG